ncbi:MAG: hypothetical protein ACR2MQ_10490 [Gemmatimonadaceae bacterium]
MHLQTSAGSTRPSRTAALSFCLALLAVWASPASAQRIEVSFPASLRTAPVTGRMIVVVARDSEPEPRFGAGSFGGKQPFYGLDLSALAPGAHAVIDSSTDGYPISLADLPAGDYYVQAVLNVYTQFHRADGHVIWAHMDQWEGQHWNRSPAGELGRYSATEI